jgi:hypothetical protein
MYPVLSLKLSVTWSSMYGIDILLCDLIVQKKYDGSNLN